MVTTPPSLLAALNFSDIERKAFICKLISKAKEIYVIDPTELREGLRPHPHPSSFLSLPHSPL